MSKQKSATPSKVIFSNEQLRNGSMYLKYHVKMYIETLFLLQGQIAPPSGWDTERNSILESHLIHARILIDFLRTRDSSTKSTDVLAVDYFADLPDKFQPIDDIDFNELKSRIGSHLVHITTKPMPRLISEQEWPIEETARKLVEVFNKFFHVVPEASLVEGARIDCLNDLAKLSTPKINIPNSINVTT